MNWLNAIAKFLRKHLRQLILLVLFLLFIKFLAPQLYVALVGAIGSTGLFLSLLALIVIFALIWVLDSGVKSLGPCSLISYKFKPDQCLRVACNKKCTETRGPYPKWMGSWALASQATSCKCPMTAAIPGFEGLMDVFEKLKGETGDINKKEEVRKQILEAIAKDLSPEQQAIIKKIMEKIQRGEDLTSEDYDELRKILENP